MLFSFFKNIRNKLDDVKTISALCQGAEKIATQAGEEKPALEHFVLAAMELEESSAKRVLAQFDIDFEQLLVALQKQHENALKEIGIDPQMLSSDPVPVKRNKSSLYMAQPSADELIKKMYQNNKKRNVKLIGAHVLEAALQFEQGTFNRVLQLLNVDPGQLQLAVNKELGL